jgi:hypothetical protein
MRTNKLVPIFVIAAFAAFAHGPTLAGPMPDPEDVLLVTSALPKAGTTASSQALSLTVDTSDRAERETSPGERTRIVSYLILRGLQGAGPFLGLR